MRRIISLLLCSAFLLVIGATTVEAQDTPDALERALLEAVRDALIPPNVVSLDFGGASFDAQSSAIGYSRRLALHDDTGIALYAGVSHPVGSLTGARLDGNLDIRGLDWEFSDVDRAFLAPHARLRLHPLLSVTATFGDVCIVHENACDGYTTARVTLDFRLPTTWVPLTIRLGREGLIGDGALDGEWMRAISVGTALGF